jgi:hypothetical protein
MGKKETFVAGILILAVLILALTLLGREKNGVAPPGDRIQAIEDKNARSRQMTAGAITSFTGEKEMPETTSSAPARSDGEANLDKRVNSSSPTVNEIDTGGGSPTAEAPMTSAEFTSFVREQKEALAREQGSEALQNLRTKEAIRGNERTAREEHLKKIETYNAERREWKRHMDEAKDLARQTGDFTEVNRLRKTRPKPPARESSPLGDGEGN